MHLIYRPAALPDIAQCFEMFPDGFVCEPDLWEQLPNLWRSWLGNGLMLMAVVEDSEGEAGPGLLGFGSSMFVAEDFASRSIASGPPPIAAEVARLSLGGNCPILSPAEVRRANSGDGLNLLVQVVGFNASLSEESLPWVKAKLFESFHYMHGGFQIKLAMQEVYGIEELDRANAVGALLLSDYAAYYKDNAPPDVRAWLTGIDRERIVQSCALWPLFMYSRPRIFFTDAEQEVLRLALLDMTDSEIVRALHISAGAIHKRWGSLLDRAAASDVEWLPSAARSQQRQPGRGIEKRRHLLRYLRSHPEELRPVVAPPDRSVRRRRHADDETAD